MISVHIKGGLGNQMFQFAFAQAAAHLLSTSFVLRANSKFKLDEYFVLAGFSKTKNKFKESFFLPKKRLHCADLITPSAFIKRLSNNTHYTGYFQSEIYFSNVANVVKECFKIKPDKQIESSILNQYDAIVHCRGGDYKNFTIPTAPNSPCLLPKSYYEQAFRELNINTQMNVCVVTDDRNYAKGVLPESRNFTIHSGNEIEAFQLMTHHPKVIIANSSFSWWAAYLNNFSDKSIIAPKNWLGYRTKDLYPSGIEYPNFKWI